MDVAESVIKAVPPQQKKAPETLKNRALRLLVKRRGRDSNPRYPLRVHRFSRPAHSATLAPLRLMLPIAMDQVGDCPVVNSLLVIGFVPRARTAFNEHVRSLADGTYSGNNGMAF